MSGSIQMVETVNSIHHNRDQDTSQAVVSQGAGAGRRPCGVGSATEGRVVEEDGKVARARGHDHITPVYCIWVCVSHVRTLVLCEGSAQVL